MYLLKHCSETQKQTNCGQPSVFRYMLESCFLRSVFVVQWLSDLREKVTLHDGTPVPVVLLANKCDIQGIDISSETMAKFCRDNGIAAWFVTSAKENINIGK